MFGEHPLITELRREMVDRMNLDVHCQFVWGKHTVDCTEHEISEARRLMDAPFGGGFEPRTEGTN